MKRVNEDLMEAAGNGDKAGLKAILLLPQCDPTSKDGHGLTALMLAAINGHASCAELLITVSDSLVKDNYGETASEMASDHGHTSLAAFIDAYALALSEMSVLDAQVTPRAPRNKASLRV